MKTTTIRATLLLLPMLAGCVFATPAAEIPALVIPEGVGVNIHFTRGHAKDLDMIAEAGFKWVRMDFGWGGIERTKGEYDWSAYDELTANLEPRGLRALYILDYSNPLYEETVTSRNPITGKEDHSIASPQHPESVAAFARWAAAAAQRYAGRHVIWEIWNEPNISFWRPKPDVNQYLTLALATCKAIREADQRATIVAPATSGFPREFLEKFCASGVLEHLDAVSVHPYRNYSQPPESAADDYRKLRDLIQAHAPAAKQPMPILSGEWGYATHTKGIAPETQAHFIARQQLANLLHGVPISIWYDWKDDGTDPDEREHHFGTVTHDLQPKPAYEAVRRLTRELAGYRVAKRLDVGEEDYVLLCVSGTGARKLAAWTLGQPHEVRLEVQQGPRSEVQTVLREGLSAAALGPKDLVLKLSAAPQYVSLNGIKLRE